MVFLTSCSEPNKLDLLKEEILSAFENEEGTFAMAFKNLDNGETLFINEKENFHAASTMKTPVMIELYKQANHGHFNLSDSILIKDEFYSIVDSSRYKMDIGEDSEAKLYDLVGKKLPISELNYEMITKSSNLATNILIDLVDAKKVTKTMRDLGAPDIKVLRGVEDIKAFEKGLSNSTTAYDLLVIFEKLAKGEAVNAVSSESMLKVLRKQYFNDIIPVYLPDDVTVAHKTGSITGVHHDSGLITLPDGTQYVLVLLSKELSDFDQGTETLARVSKMIYDQIIS
jgi:beta-lactamase class A